MVYCISEYYLSASYELKKRQFVGEWFGVAGIVQFLMSEGKTWKGVNFKMILKGFTCHSE